MKKRLLALFATSCFFFAAKAQYVTIPDTAFVSWLKNNGYAQCMNGNQLNTACAAVLNEDTITLDNLPITNLEGIQYFTGLKELIISKMPVSTFPAMPPALITLHCVDNYALASFPAFPATLEGLFCQSIPVTEFPTLPASLQRLYCSITKLDTLTALPASLRNITLAYSDLRSLPALPPNLRWLEINTNNLSSLPALPSTLNYLRCDDNLLTSLPSLPASLTTLNCYDNPIPNLPALPAGLISLSFGSPELLTVPQIPATVEYLDIRNTTTITSLPGSLPPALRYFYCSGNRALKSLPALPALLTSLTCVNNDLDSLGTLPPNISYLSCGSNNINSLPALPSSLKTLYTSRNPLSSIPALPDTMHVLSCQFNQITELPELPSVIGQLDCSYNPQLTCLPRLTKIGTLNFANTGITCLPNYGTVTTSFPALSSLPFCAAGNANGCAVNANMLGTMFNDINSNCQQNTGDSSLKNIPVQLWHGGTLEESSFSIENGAYALNTTINGIYDVRVDTANNFPLQVVCPANNLHTDTVTSASITYTNDFGLRCNNNFDLEARSAATTTRFRPATITPVHVSAGDASAFYNARCAAGISGTVVVTINGPATYHSPANGALTPAVSGNVLTYTVADFGTINATAFNFNVLTDTSATINDQICFSVVIAATSSTEANLSNNVLNQCFEVRTSYDPNEKQAYPAGNTDTATKWLTYTVYFQNTGNDTAINIYIMDTLDARLNPATFRLLAYSHHPQISIDKGGIAKFMFPNIMLPDSNVNEPLSHGYVQYKVRLKDNLPIGTRIENTAYIYFDYNAPIVTNTTVNTLSVSTGIATVNNNAAAINLFPNPATNQLYISTTGWQAQQLVVYNINGQKVIEQLFTPQLDISALTPGLYFIDVKNGASTARSRFVKTAY